MIDRTGNLADMKSRITSFIKIHGPSLPIHISKETKSTLLLASAFLADMVSEKTIKISNLKVGGSPVYFLPGQEQMLENFHKFLPGKEREAFQLLKDRKILKEDEQEPAIRVALKNIKDFAVPYTIKYQDQSIVFWQYFSATEEEAKNLISEKLEILTPKPLEPSPVQEMKPEPKLEIEEPKVIEEIKETVQEEVSQEKKEEKKIEPIFASDKKSRIKKPAFLEQIKLHLAGRNIEIVHIEKVSKKDILARVKENDKEFILLALDKKKIEDSDLLKAFRRAQTLNIPYKIIAKGEPSKKLKEAIDASRSLDSVHLLE